MFSRSFTRLLPGAVLLLLLVVLPVRAAEFAASTADELVAAVVQANANGETDTITLVGNPTLTLTTPLEITGDLTIVGPATVSGTDIDFLLANFGGTTTLDHLTFRNCATMYGTVVVSNAALIATSCTFLDNTAIAVDDLFGGGISGYYGDVTLTDSTFTGNTTTAGAGAVGVQYGTLTASGCTFTANMSPYENTWGGFGGAITTMWCPVTLTDSTFSENTSMSIGGAVSCIFGYVNLDGCTFTENSASFAGGAVFASTQGMTVDACTFTGNRSLLGGAIGYSSVASEDETDYLLLLTGCAFHDNSVEGQVIPDSGMAIAGGGAIATSGGAVALNCQFTNNRARVIYASDEMSVEAIGGAVLCMGGSFDAASCSFSANSVTSVNTSSFGSAQANGGAIGTFRSGYYNIGTFNCTFSGNTANASATAPESASAFGGGITLAGSVTLRNTILWGNLANGTLNQAEYVVGDFPYHYVSYCDIQDNPGGIWDGMGNIDADPAFVRNPGSGEDGIWGTADDDAGDLTLTAGSPCIDAGSNDYVFTDVMQTDLAGNSRIVNDIVDMGAYEYQGGVVADTTPPVITTPGNLTATATSSTGAVVNFTVSAEDDVDGVITPTVAPASGSVFPLGTTTVNCSATDAAGNTATESFTATVTYAWSGFLQPIDPPNAQGISSSVFKAGSTVPIKFTLTGASAGITTATAQLTYAKISNAVVGSDVEAISTAASTTGNLFRYDPQAGQYIFNWSTKGLTSGTYRISVTLGDGVSRTVIISLK